MTLRIQSTELDALNTTEVVDSPRAQLSSAQLKDCAEARVYRVVCDKHRNARRGNTGTIRRWHLTHALIHRSFHELL